jgi:two-component system LytT family sensor kinase
VSHAINYFQKYREREISLSQAQLEVMRMQLNPHFLFNTLNAISELVYESPENADRTITRLSDLLRLSLKGGQAQEVPLHEELVFLEKYVEIQRTLLQERLMVKLDIAPDTYGASVPNMMLQPLVENAIRHGIAPRSSSGRIEVCTRREGSVLRIEIRDDGIGLIGDAGAMNNGIGLANTRSRLAALYGDLSALELKESPGGGLTVSLRIPFREAE